jgi:hypothetical protein
MDQIGHDQHTDVTAEVGQRLGQGLAVFATLGEAGARLAAEEMRRRERREEQAKQQRHADRRRQKAARRLAEQADRLAQHAARRRAQHDRRVLAQALAPDWLDRADLLDLATVWRTARVREGEFPEARAAAEMVEERLRQMYPRPMDVYDQAVRGGTPRAEAMRAAAAEMAHTPVMRPHGGRRSAAVGGAGTVVGDAAFTAAVSEEQIRLATGVDAETYTAELQRLGAGGDAAARALREALAARAGREMAQGRRDAATPDDPSTVGVDEHTTVGMPRNARDVGEANRDQAAAATRTAAQLAGEWYPEGLHHPTGVPAHVAGTQPATAVPINTRTRAAGRSR